MNINHLLFSLFSLISAIFFLLLGIFAVMVPWVPALKVSIIRFLQENSIVISLFGFAFLIVGTAIVINIILGTKRRYYHVKSGQNAVSVDENLIKGYLETYFHDLFPGQEIPSHLVIKQNKIHVMADLPTIPMEEQKDILEKIEKDLGEVFTTVLGYRNEFYLNISFLEK